MTPAEFAAIVEEISCIWPAKGAWPTEIQKPGARSENQRQVVWSRWRTIGADAMRHAITTLETESAKVTPTPALFVEKARAAAKTDPAADQQLAEATCASVGHPWAVTADWILAEAAANHGRVTVRCARCNVDRQFPAQRLWEAGGYRETNGPLPQPLYAAGEPSRALSLEDDRSERIAP